MSVSQCVRRFEDTQLNKCSFSIDHILNVAGEKQDLENFHFSAESEEDKKYEWLTCTRYRPPKLPRNRKREGVQRRKLGRNPRIPFSSSQVAFLEAKFLRSPYLSSSDVTQLATYLQLSETRVKIWFQNRRARERRDRETKVKGQEDSTNQRLSPEIRDSSKSVLTNESVKGAHLEDFINVKSLNSLPFHYYHPNLRYLAYEKQSYASSLVPLNLAKEV